MTHSYMPRTQCHTYYFTHYSSRNQHETLKWRRAGWPISFSRLQPHKDKMETKINDGVERTRKTKKEDTELKSTWQENVQCFHLQASSSFFFSFSFFLSILISIIIQRKSPPPPPPSSFFFFFGFVLLLRKGGGGGGRRRSLKMKTLHMGRCVGWRTVKEINLWKRRAPGVSKPQEWKMDQPVSR